MAINAENWEKDLFINGIPDVREKLLLAISIDSRRYLVINESNDFESDWIE